MSMNILNDISAVYLQQIAEKKDDSYLETDMEKRHENNEKAREDMKKTKAYKDMAAAARKKMEEGLDPVGQEDSDIDNDGDTDKSDKYLHKRRKAIGNAISKKKSVKEALDPVGQEDDDIDNDGDTDSSDKYLHKRRKAIGKAISKKSVKEGFSNWRQDLAEVMDDVEANKQIKEKKVNNKIKINPEMKEAVEELGGELIEMVEIDEGMTMKDFKQQRSRQKQKEKRASDKIAPNRRKNIHTDRYSPERAARHRANVDPDFEGNDERNYPGGKLNPKKVRKAKALGELGEEVLDEIAPLAAGALAAGALAAPYLLKKFAKPKVDKALDTETQRIQKNKGLTQMNSYEPEGEVIDEKAVSKSQQRFMGMVYAAKKGETPASPEVAKAAKAISKGEAKKFAKTKHEGLPDKVKEELEVIDERRREDKGTPRPQRDRALEVVKGMIRQQTGTPAGQRKKVPGKKPPTAGQYGAPKSPAQKLKLRKAQQQRSQDWQQDTKGT